jgi:hypothetical protein
MGNNLANSLKQEKKSPRHMQSPRSPPKADRCSLERDPNAQVIFDQDMINLH